MTERKIMASDQARTNWRTVLDSADAGEDIVIERYGKRTAVVISYEDYEEVQNELEELRAARRAAAVFEAWKRDRSTARPLDDIRAELVAEGAIDEPKEPVEDSGNAST